MDVITIDLMLRGKASPATNAMLDSAVLGVAASTRFALLESMLLTTPAKLLAIIVRFASPPLTEPEVSERVAKTAAGTVRFILGHGPEQRSRLDFI